MTIIFSRNMVLWIQMSVKNIATEVIRIVFSVRLSSAFNIQLNLIFFKYWDTLDNVTLLVY
jgi:hypothetical protein